MQVDVAAVMHEAKAAGIERAVVVSSQAVLTRPESPSHGVVMRNVEEAVVGSGLEWTVLRPSGFASNAYAWVDIVREHRVTKAPFGDVGLPVIHPTDIAAVAAAAPCSSAHSGDAYVLTGPELVTPRQQAGAISEAIGERVDFVELSRAQAHERMTQFIPADVVETTLKHPRGADGRRADGQSRGREDRWPSSEDLCRVGGRARRGVPLVALHVRQPHTRPGRRGVLLHPRRPGRPRVAAQLATCATNSGMSARRRPPHAAFSSGRWSMSMRICAVSAMSS